MTLTTPLSQSTTAVNLASTTVPVNITKHKEELVTRLLTTHQQTLSQAETMTLLKTWLDVFDPNVAFDCMSETNSMHVYGQCVCIHLSRHFQQQVEEYGLSDALEDIPELSMFQEPLHQMSWAQTQAVVLGIQIQFCNLFQMQDEIGFVSLVDMQRLLLMLAAHCGWFFDHKWRCDNKTDVELGILKANNQLWLRVHDQHVVAVLDALHTMMNMSNILLTSEFVSAVATQNAVIPLHNYHREASIDDFYDLSMVADCPVGSIVQYKHRFRFLFHSVSQVIFFHYPNYARHKQLPLTELQNPTCNSIHILPLLQQIDPDIPVFHEHTGATMSSLINLTTQHNWAWLVLGRHIVLFNNLKQSFCAFDLRTLLAKVNPLLCEHTHHKDESNT